MTLTSTEKALTVARVGCLRVGAFRVGYAPKHTRSAATGSTTGPLAFWRQVYKPTVSWTKVER